MSKFTAALVAAIALCLTIAPSGQSVIPVPKAAFYDNNGNPCASCRLYAYIAGTTTPQATYSDSALTTPNTNPIILDSAGRATIFADNTKSYKFTLSTAADVPIWTVDNITGQLASIVTVTAANTRGLQITRSAAEAGLSISSVGGSGKTYGIASTTAGALVLRDDADGTPNITINAGDQIVLTAANGVSTPNAFTATGVGTFSTGVVSIANAGNATALQVQGRGADNLSEITFNDNPASTQYAKIGMVAGAVLRFHSTSAAGFQFTGGGINGPLQLGTAITPAALAADQNNYNPTGLSTAMRVRLSTSGGGRNITGLAAQSDGQIVTLINFGPDQITLVQESGSSTASNRFMDSTALGQGDFVIVMYDSTSSRWVLSR